jgi:site-specific recombinase XerD
MYFVIITSMETYQSDKRIEGFSPQTLKAYQLQVTLLIRHFGDVEINSLTTEQLREYLSESSETLKPSSLAHRIRSMKSLHHNSNLGGTSYSCKNGAYSFIQLTCPLLE